MVAKAQAMRGRRSGWRARTPFSAPELTDIPTAAWRAAHRQMGEAGEPTAIRQAIVRTPAAVAAPTEARVDRVAIAGTARSASEAWAGLPSRRPWLALD